MQKTHQALAEQCFGILSDIESTTGQPGSDGTQTTIRAIDPQAVVQLSSSPDVQKNSQRPRHEIPRRTDLPQKQLRPGSASVGPVTAGTRKPAISQKGTDMTTNAASADLRAAIVQASRLLFTAGMMSHSGHGNFSARVDDDRFLLTSIGVVRDLRPEQLATITFGGDVIDGDLGPENAEIIQMHSVIYKAREEIAAVIYTHSPAATAFALANRPLPCRTEPLLRFGQSQPVPVAPWGPRGSGVSVKGIATVLAENPGTNAVLLGNHGLLAFGPDPVATGRLVTAIEESAAAELAAAALGGAADFPQGALDAVRAEMETRQPGA